MKELDIIFSKITNLIEELRDPGVRENIKESLNKNNIQNDSLSKASFEEYKSKGISNKELYVSEPKPGDLVVGKKLSPMGPAKQSRTYQISSTKSGKPIFSDHMHSSHAEFNVNDHLDAANAFYNRMNSGAYSTEVKDNARKGYNFHYNVHQELKGK